MCLMSGLRGLRQEPRERVSLILLRPRRGDGQGSGLSAGPAGSQLSKTVGRGCTLVIHTGIHLAVEIALHCYKA